MTAISTTTALTILIILGGGWILMGWWLGRKSISLEEYMLAGRNVGFALASSTALATWITSNTTLVAPQLTYQFGVWGMLGYSMAATGLILFATLAKRIRRLMPRGFTCGDFFRLRYGRFAWGVFLIVSICYALGWMVSLGMAGGVLLSALSDLGYALGVTVILVICVFYTMLGGLKAIIATDFIQAVVILLGLIIVGYACIDKLSLESIYYALEDLSPQLLNLIFPAAIMFFFNSLFFGVGEIFHSNVWWSRAFSFKSGVGEKAFLLAGFLWFPIPITAGFVALVAPLIGVYPPVADMVGPLIAASILGGVGAAVIFVVVFAAIASSLDSLLAATSDLLTKDVYAGMINSKLDDRGLIVVKKIFILALGFFTWIVCLPRISTLGEVLNFISAFVSSTIWPIVFGLYYMRLPGWAASMAMILGSTIGLTAYFLIGFYVAALVSTGVSLIVCLIGVLSNKNKFDWVCLKERDKIA
ncbi:sodium:solute symporter family transporter [Microbulbifer sp. ANSA005]|uniref:sodium:solute symporter family transporter n=1 Tax=Microbulbifer sp. ANSA005 TaxID=3243362 RepID=UPI004043860E